MAYMPFKRLNNKTDYRVFTPNYYAMTPRWESRVAGVYVPLVYNNNNNEDKDFTIGATVRVGPVFVGSSNLLTLLKKDNIQAADAHVGLKIPMAHGKPSKAAEWFKKFTNEKETSSTTEETEKSTETIEKTKESKKTIEKTIEKDIETTPNTRPIQIIINNYNGADPGGTNRQRIIDVDPVTGETIERTVIINDNTETPMPEVKEMNNLQEQIEFLKFKLKQKENLINELEKEQERINNGNSTEGSKKKIDSLKDEYLYNKNFDYESVPQKTATTTEEQAAQLFELRKELLNLDSRNVALDKKVAKISQLNAEQVSTNTANQTQKELLAEVKTLIELIQKEEGKALQPAQAYVHPAPDYTPIIKNNTKEKVGTATQSKSVSTDKSSVPYNQNSLSKADLNNLINKADYENLRNEIRALRTEVKTYQNAETQLTKKTTAVVVPTVIPAPRTFETKIIRDTIYLEKPVETVVTKIIRDTITNTIERNNTVTQTKFKEVEVKIDNSEEYLLGLPPYFVLFDVGSKDIKSIYKGRLDYYAKQLNEKPSFGIALTGHADATGNAARNLELSQQRANTVRTYLVSKGVTIDRISLDFSGDKNPLDTNETKVGKSQNRRVEVLFVK